MYTQAITGNEIVLESGCNISGLFCENSGSHGGKYEDGRRVGYSALDHSDDICVFRLDWYL
jgi:hypothetical protein